jgi:type IV pilus assembly protein PilC
MFSRQFATMINAGVPIVQSLAILKDQSASKKMQGAIGDMAKRVEGGSTLANALEAHADIFNPIYINMVRAGETGGILDSALDRLATQQEKDAEIVSKVKGAAIYPAVVFTITMGAFFFLMTYLMPKLAVLFESMGGGLPIYTKALLAISAFLVHFGVFIIVALIVGIIFFVRWKKTHAGKRAWDRLLLKTPVLGPIIMKVNVARFARTFGSLMSSGISVLEAIKATAAALNNSIYQDEFTAIAQKVKNGKPMSDSLRGSPYFPPIVAQMISVGEETGQLDTILLKLADFYEKEVDNVVANISSIIEPVLIVVLGGMVGLIVVSVFGPISNLESNIGNAG